MNNETANINDITICIKNSKSSYCAYQKDIYGYIWLSCPHDGNNAIINTGANNFGDITSITRKYIRYDQPALYVEFAGNMMPIWLTIENYHELTRKIGLSDKFANSIL